VGGANDGDCGRGRCGENFCQFGGFEDCVEVQGGDVEAWDWDRDVGWVGACAEDQAGGLDLELIF
jgi:hypothetical protein